MHVTSTSPYHEDDEPASTPFCSSILVSESDVEPASDCESSYTACSDQTYVPETEDAETDDVCSDDDASVEFVLPQTCIGPNLGTSPPRVTPSAPTITASAPVVTPKPQAAVGVATGKKWGKQHGCLYCSKMVLKMSTHLERKHSHELEVAAVLQLPKNSKERRDAFVELLHQGDYKHNYDVLLTQPGTVIPKYRKEGYEIDDLIACQFCRGMYRKSLISKHAHKCSKNPDPTRKQKWGECSRLGQLLIPHGKGCSEDFFQTVISGLRDDDVSSHSFRQSYSSVWRKTVFQNEIQKGTLKSR